MKVKYVTDIIKEIQARGSIEVPEGYITGEDFEKWLREGKENFETNISERVKELRVLARKIKKYGTTEELKSYKAISEAADTIEGLSAKLQAANMDNGGGWILCEDKTPDKEGLYIIHVITGTGEDYVGTWLYQRGVHLSGKQTYIDDKQGYWATPYNGDPVNEYLTQNVVAWQPLPEPYRP